MELYLEKEGEQLLPMCTYKPCKITIEKFMAILYLNRGPGKISSGTLNYLRHP